MPYDIIYMWNLKYDTNEFINETKTDSQIHREQTDGCQGKDGGRGWGWGLPGCHDPILRPKEKT